MFFLQTFLSLIFQSCSSQATDHKLSNMTLLMCLYVHLLQAIISSQRMDGVLLFRTQYVLSINGSCVVMCPQ